MRIRFQADADLNHTILLATVRREPAIDFQSAFAAGLAHRRDREVLGIAAREGPLLVTHDQKTMPQHFAEFVALETSPGAAGGSPTSCSRHGGGGFGADLVCHGGGGMD